MTPELEALWTLYCDGGLTLQQVADSVQSSYGRVRRDLMRHPEFAALARSRRLQAAHESSSSRAKPFDAAEALSMLRQGLGLRAVALHFHVCHRTLHKRLRDVDGYAALMANPVRRGRRGLAAKRATA